MGNFAKYGLGCLIGTGILLAGLAVFWLINELIWWGRSSILDLIF